MKSAPAMPQSMRDFSDKDFQVIASAAKKIIGIHLEPSKKALIQARLSKRFRQTGVFNAQSYCDLLQDPKANERDQFVSALTTNVTHFFRERHHFKFLEEKVLSDLLCSARTGRKVQIWSAGCSTGQEPYSISGTVLSQMPNAVSSGIEILATDVDKSVIQKAKMGVYQTDELRFDNADDFEKIFPKRDNRANESRVREDVRKLIKFESLNLVDRWPDIGAMDVIFCRNVAIYFDKDVQNTLWSRFVDQIKPGGFLFIGHSERLRGAAAEQMRPVGVTIYQKEN